MLFTRLRSKKIGFFLVTLAVWLFGAARLEAGQVVKCSTTYENVNYYEIKKITRCIVRMNKAKMGEYLAVKTPNGRVTLAEGKVVKRKGPLSIILLTKSTDAVRPKLPVDFSDSIPDEDIELSRYTSVKG